MRNPPRVQTGLSRAIAAAHRLLRTQDRPTPRQFDSRVYDFRSRYEAPPAPTRTANSRSHDEESADCCHCPATVTPRMAHTAKHLRRQPRVVSLSTQQRPAPTESY